MDKKIHATDKLISRILYKLYDLSNAEIRTIEEAKSKEYLEN